MFTLTIDTDNDAFADNPAPEIARILRELAGTVERYNYGSGVQVDWLRDINGNRVGTWKHAPNRKADALSEEDKERQRLWEQTGDERLRS